MRVIQAMAGAPHGGAEIFFERLTAALSDDGKIEQQILIRENPERASRLRARGLQVRELRFGGPLDIRSRFQFRAAIKSFSPDAVITWMNRATGHCPRANGDFVHIARLGGYYNLKYYRHCDHLIGNTQSIVDYLVSAGWPAERAHFLPNFVPATRAKPTLRAELDTPESAPLLVAMGRLHANKAFDVLLRAVARLDDVFLWLAGDGPLDRELRNLSAELNIDSRVRFLGWRDDGAALLAAADCLVCPSRVEPLGNVVLEAWAQKVPVVAAKSDGPKALISDRVNGLLASIDDDQDLATAIRDVLEKPDLGRKLADAGHQEYLERYTEPVVTARYVDFLKQVATPCAA